MATERVMQRLSSLGLAPQWRGSSAGSVGAASSGSAGTTDKAEPAATDTAVKVLIRSRPIVPDMAALGVQVESNSERESVKLELPQDVSSSPSASSARARLSARSFRCNKYFGPDATQADVFEHAQSIVNWIMEGYNAAIMCYGTTGSGKTYTMMGPESEVGKVRQPESLGVAQRVSRNIFEYIRDRSSQGEVFMVEASSLFICSEDGVQEKLIDLLAEGSASQEVVLARQDSDAGSSYVCDGLRKLPIDSPDAMIDVLEKSRRRAHELEREGVCQTSKAHTMFMLAVESMKDNQGDADSQDVKRGQLMLVDLAGSENSLLRGGERGEDQLQQRQAMHINRSLTALGALVSNRGESNGPQKSESCLITLMRDCLGASGSAHGILIANIGLEVESLEESAKTLSFAQQMMSVRHQANVHRIKQEHSSLMQMKSRHAACIKLLQEKALDTSEKESEEKRKLQVEMDELNKRLVTQETAEKTLEQMKVEQQQKIDAMRDEMSKQMSLELERMRTQTLEEMANLRHSVEQHVTKLDDVSMQRQAEDHENKVQKMQQEVQVAVAAQQAAEEEVANSRVRLASAEERSKMLTVRLDELRRDRVEFEEERIKLRHQNEQQWQKLANVEGELQKFKSEAEVQQAEMARLHAAQASELEAAQRDRSERQAKEEELQKEVRRLQKEIDDAKRETEVQAIRFEADKKEQSNHLQSQISSLEREAETRSEQLQKLGQAVEKAVKERDSALQREEEMRRDAEREALMFRAELDEAKRREDELVTMLSEVQESIVVATHGRGS